MLTDAQVERYSRQIVLPEVGGRGQERLLAARVAIVGFGPAAVAAVTLLGRAGVGALDVSESVGPLPELSPDCRLSRPGAGRLEGVFDAVIELAGDAETGIHRMLVDDEQATRPFLFGDLDGARIFVTTLVGRPCIACFGAYARETRLFPAEGAGRQMPAAPGQLALGALAASEALRVLLSPPARGRLTALSLEDGTGKVTDLTSTGGCTVCGGRA